MAEGFVLNISKEMLSRLDAADRKIVQIGESAEKAMKKINEAFGKNLGVEGFIKQLNDIQQQLTKKDLKVNVDLALKNGALDSLKKQIEALGITIPVGVTATGTGGSNSAGAVPNGLNEALSRIATTIDAMNKTLASVVNIQEKLVNNNTQQGGKGRSNNTTQVQDPINFSQNAKSITERIQAIKLLQKEMFNLDSTDKNYRTTLNNLNTELTRQQNVLKQVGVEISKIKTPKIEIPKPNFEPLRQQYRQNQSELKNLQSEYDNVVKKIKEAEAQMANIRAGKGGSYNPKEYQQNLGKAFNLEQEIKMYQDENKLISEKMRLLNQEYQAKVKVQQANDPKNIALIEKEKKEYEKLLKTISQLEKTKQKANRDIAKHGVNSAIGRKADVVSQQTDQQIQQAYQRKLELEKKYGTDLLQIKQANNVKELEEVRRQGNEEIREYERVRSKILEINKTLYNNNKTLKNTKDPNLQAQINNQNQALLNERSKLATRQLELERKHGNSLLSVQTQIGQREVEFERKKQQDKIREVQQALRRRQDIERRWAQRNARLTEQKRNTAEGALSFSQNEAKTIGQKLQAIKYLQNAQKSLDVTTSKGRGKFNELNREIKKTENELRRCGVQMNNFQEKSRHLFDITGQLGRALSLMFSVSQITQYVSKMVNVRKEMELQQRSLQVLLQNKDKANELWNQTLDLAVKSPFRVKELVTYTKQLAAYRIESDKLFETNKMLADVSAGLGVDMQRLILAFGQVKSASFLRGTELRQFTEAGIPMLEELSKYFSEIYGKSVSVAEVFDMISKRMVTFTDVEKVFQRMTGAGGVFFNMQEELAQTTAGLISNLQDSIDLMFNEMGKKNQGLINDVIKAARYLVDNWETVGKVMKGALLTLLLYKAATMDISKITKGLGANVKFLFSELKENPLEFFQTFKGNIVSTALIAIIALVGKAIAEHKKYKRAIEEVNKAHEKFRKSVTDVELGFAEIFHNGSDNIDEYRDKLQELIGIAKQSYNIEIDFNVNNLETIDEVSRKFDDLKNKMLSLNDFSLQFGIEFVNADNRGWGLFQDYLGEDLLQFNTSQKNISRLSTDIQKGMSSSLKNYEELKRLENERSKLLSDLYEQFGELNFEDVIAEYAKIAGSQADIEGDPIFEEFFKDLNITNLDNQQKQQLEHLVRNYVNTTESLEVVANRLKDVNTEIFESFTWIDSSKETSYDYLQRNLQGVKGILDEVTKSAGSSNVDALSTKIYDDLLNVKQVENIGKALSKYGINLEKEYDITTFVTNLIAIYGDYQDKLDEATSELNDFYQGNTESVESKANELRGREGMRSKKEIQQLIKDYTQQITEENKEELEPLIEGLKNEKTIDDELSEYIYNAIKNIATTKELDPLVLDEMLSQAENYYRDNLGYELDLLPKIKPVEQLELKEWQKAYNEEVDKILNTLESSEDKAIFLPLKIRTDLQGVATTKEKQRSVLNESIDNLTKEIEQLKIANAYLKQQYNNDEITLEQYNALYEKNIAQQEKYVKQITHLRNLLGGDDDKPKKGGGKKNINDQISLIRQLYDEFQKLNEDFGSEISMRKVVDSFDDAIKQEFGGLFDLEYLEHLVKDKSQVIGVNGGKIFAENYMKNAQNISDLDLKTNLIVDSLKTQVDDINTRVLNHIDGLKLNQTQFDVLGKLTLENVSDDELKEFEDSARGFLRKINTNDLDMKGELFHSTMDLSSLLKYGINSDNLQSAVSLIKHIKEELVKINSLPLDGVKTFQNNITDNFNIIRDNWDYLSNDIKNQLIQLGILGDEIEILPKEDLDAYVQDVKSSVSGILNEIPKLGDFKSPVKDLYNEIMSLKQNTNETNADFANRITRLYEQIQTYAKIELPEIELPEIELPDTINIEDKLTSDNARKLAQTLESIGKIEIITDSQVKDFELKLTNALNFIKKKYPKVIKSLSEEDKNILGVLYNGGKQNNESNADYVKRLKETYEDLFPKEDLDAYVQDVKSSVSGILNEIPKLGDFKSPVKDLYNEIMSLEQNTNETNADFANRITRLYEQIQTYAKIELPEIELPKIELPKIELPELNIPEITYNYDFSELDEYLNSLQIELPELNLKGEMLETLATMSSDVSLAEQHVNYLHDALLKLDEENNTNYASRFGENFVKSIKEAETEAERMALLIQTIGLETKDLDSYLESQAIADNLASQFTGVDLSNFSFELSDKAIDFTTLEGIVEALEKLRPKAEKIGKEAVDALEKAIAEAKVEIEVRAKIKKNEEIVQSIEDMFSGYEIGLEFKKLDISPSFVQGLLPEAFEDLDLNTSLDNILNRIQEKRNELAQENLISTDATEEEREGYRKLLKQLDDAEKKVTDMMNQEQMNRLQTYLGLAREAIGERAKIKIEELKKLRDVEDMYAKKEKDGTLTEQDKAQKNSIQEHIRENTKIQMDKLEWEEFQKTDTFINLFRDLENASETMLTSTLQKLQEFKEQWKDMPLEDMKQVIEKINELEMALANLSPRDTIKKSKENLNKYIEENNIEGNYSDAIANLQKENFEFEIENSDLEKLISNLEVYFRLLEEGKQEQADDFYAEYLSSQKPIQGVDDKGNQVKVDLSNQTAITREQLTLLRNKVQLNKDNINDNQELLSYAEKLKNAYLKQAENIGEVQEIVGQLKNGFDSVVEAASVLGADTENIELFGNMANDIISSTLGMVQLQLQLNAAQVSATGFSAAMNTAMGVIGWIVLAVQSIAKVISSIAQAKDNKLVKEIEKQQYKIEKLQKAYDDLAEKIDEAWSVRQLQEYHRELRSTTDDLITAQKAAIEAQEQRKKSSNVGSDEWKELQDMYSSLDELEKQLEDTEKEIFSKITGGIMDDTLGTAENFVDAWYDAFKETGDGLKGLEDNFNEMLLNLIKRQAAMKIAGRFMDNWTKILDRYASDDDLSNDEIIMYAEKVKGDLPILSGQLEAFYKSFDQILGDTQGNLSGLQRGIQGITEQQADILASYLNSIRFIVSDSNAQLKLLVSAQTGATTRSESPMVEQLKVIAQQTSAINTLLNSLTAPHPTLSGRGLKVVI